jgi:hypothetical protein
VKPSTKYYAFYTDINENAEIQAIWKPHSINITFNKNDGSNITVEKEYTYGIDN